MDTSDSITLMSSNRIQRSLNRIAHEINEINKSGKPILLIGIDQRGLVVANALEAILSGVSGAVVTVNPLSLDKESDAQQLETSSEMTDALIIIVDDVIFSGRTMFNALMVTDQQLAPKEIYSAVLIDRGHRKFPVSAEFYGMELPTKLDEHVSVIIEDESLKKVELIHNDNHFSIGYFFVFLTTEVIIKDITHAKVFPIYYSCADPVHQYWICFRARGNRHQQTC